MKKNVIIGTILMVTAVVIISLIITKCVSQIQANYEKPDTTITIHNGKSDTLIVKKQVPSWLK